MLGKIAYAIGWMVSCFQMNLLWFRITKLRFNPMPKRSPKPEFRIVKDDE